MNFKEIKYCAQDLKFEEEAYKEFEEYENELKKYFLDQEDGLEIFEDLKLRICELLQSKTSLNEGFVSLEHIEELKKNIGQVNQLEEFEDSNELVDTNYENLRNKRQLFRSETDKIISGVCGGMGNYFSIDPLAFRLLFVLVAILSKGIGIVAYLIFWLVLKPKDLPINSSKRLFRNGADKVIGGVCGGLSSFFGIEAWIVRVIFLGPIILNFLTDGLLNFGFSFFDGSAIGLTIILYIILWIATKETETPTEELMARGENLTINSIGMQKERNQNSPDLNSSLNNVLRIIAFVIIAISIGLIVLMLIGLVFLYVFGMSLANAILFTPVLKWLGLLSVCFFLLLPIVALIIWAIRRFNSVKGPNRNLRISFGSLWGLGFAAAITLGFLLWSELKSEATVTETINIETNSDTLYVNRMERKGDLKDVKVKNASSIFSSFYSKSSSGQSSNIVSFKKKVSDNGKFYIVINKTARGKGEQGAIRNAQIGNIKYNVQMNKIDLAKVITIPKNEPFRFQHADITFYVPEGKELIVDPLIKKFKNKKKDIKIDLDWEDINEETKEEIEENIEDVVEEVGEALEDIGERLEEVGVSIEKAAKESNKISERHESENEIIESKRRIKEQKLKIKEEQLELKKLEKQLKKE